MHRPCLVVFGSLNRAWTMFGSTMVTGYPGRSSLLWPGELVIRSTIMYRGEGKTDNPYESVVSKWAYVKELATMNTRGRGEWSLLGYTWRGNVVGDREKGRP